MIMPNAEKRARLIVEKSSFRLSLLAALYLAPDVLQAVVRKSFRLSIIIFSEKCVWRLRDQSDPLPEQPPRQLLRRFDTKYQTLLSRGMGHFRSWLQEPRGTACAVGATHNENLTPFMSRFHLHQHAWLPKCFLYSCHTSRLSGRRLRGCLGQPFLALQEVVFFGLGW